jgi:hypothetical protein
MALARSGRQMLRPMSSGLRYDLATRNGQSRGVILASTFEVAHAE